MENNCGICHLLLTGKIGKLKCSTNVEHLFHLSCILEWSKISNTCPYDRISFTNINVFHNQKEIESIPVEPKKQSISQFIQDYFTSSGQDDHSSIEDCVCKVCQQGDRPESLLLCDGCEDAYHLDCLSPPLSRVPEGDWYCKICLELRVMAGLEQRRESTSRYNPYQDRPNGIKRNTRPKRLARVASSLPAASSSSSSSNRPTNKTSLPDDPMKKELKKLKNQLLKEVYSYYHAQSQNIDLSQPVHWQKHLKQPFIIKSNQSVKQVEKLFMSDYKRHQKRVQKEITEEEKGKKKQKNDPYDNIWDAFEEAKKL